MPKKYRLEGECPLCGYTTYKYFDEEPEDRTLKCEDCGAEFGGVLGVRRSELKVEKL